MSKKKKFGVSQALSRGFSETIAVVENNAGTFRNSVISLSRIELDPDNPRKLKVELDDVRLGLRKDDPDYTIKAGEYERLREMSETIKTSGIINPIVAYKHGDKYRVVAGERRCLASILAGKGEIDARVFNDKPSGFLLKLLQWVENTAREDLSLAERIGNIRDILSAYLNEHNIADQEISATLLKEITGLSLPQATYYLAVLNAPEEINEAIASGDIRNLDKAALIAKITQTQLRKQALEACIHGASIKELRKLINADKSVSNNLSKRPAIKKRGRSATRVSLGHTKHTHVAKKIVDSVTALPEYQKFATHFTDINWDHYEQVTCAFRKFINLLEAEN